MLFLFGTRASHVHNTKIQGTNCGYCKKDEGFVVSTFSRYAHFFFIPLFPIGKKKVAECMHCRKTYDQSESPSSFEQALQMDAQNNPVKTPFWQGCGCMIIALAVIFFIVTMIIGALTASVMDEDNEEKDYRIELLAKDRRLIAKNIPASDSLSTNLKFCIDLSLGDQMDVDRIGYYSTTNESKLLILINAPEMSDFESSSRKNFLELIEECANAFKSEDIKQVYIGIHGTYNPVMVKTPSRRQDGGRFADFDYLLPFYGADERYQQLILDNEESEMVIDTTTYVKTEVELLDISKELVHRDVKDLLYNLIYDATENPTKKSLPIAYHIKNCVDHPIFNNIDKDEIAYNYATYKNRLLLIMSIRDIENIEREDRYKFISPIEECLKKTKENTYSEIYIAIDGHTDLVALKTPSKTDHNGVTADDTLLFDFFR